MAPFIRARPAPVAHLGEPMLIAHSHNWAADLELKIEYLNPSQISRPKRETRKHSAKQVTQIEASIRAHGFINPIIIDAESRIVAGVGRYLAAQSMKLSRLPAIRVEHLTDDQLRILSIADNRLVENAQWDDARLAIELSELMTNDEHPIELTGFDSADIDRLILSACSVNQAADADETVTEPDDNVAPISVRGDIFVIGQHRLICGDARDSDDYAALMRDELARMVFTDPPYNVRIENNVSGFGKTQHKDFMMGCGEMPPAQFTDFLSDIFAQLDAHSIDGSIHYLCMDWRHQSEMMEAGNRIYSELKNLLVWNKTNAGMGSFYRSQHELIYAWKKGDAPHLNTFGLGSKGRYRTNVLNYAGANSFHRDRDSDLTAHSTVKPTLLVADLIRDVSHVGDIVLDACTGSGTTILAAERTRRRARCLELDPKYVDVAVRRAEQRLGKIAVHEATGLSFAELAQQRAAGQTREEIAA